MDEARFVLKCFGKREKKLEILAPFFDLSVPECLKSHSYNIKRLELKKKIKSKLKSKININN
jgi:hypothetical protein